MRTTRTIINALALSACLIAQVSAAGEFKISGVRRAIQTLSDQPRLVEALTLSTECDVCDQGV